MTRPALKLAVRSPEKELADLFAQEAVLLDELRDCRAAQAQARERYARTHGLLAFPSFDKLRDVVRRANAVPAPRHPASSPNPVSRFRPSGECRFRKGEAR